MRDSVQGPRTATVKERKKKELATYAVLGRVCKKLIPPLMLTLATFLDVLVLKKLVLRWPLYVAAIAE